MFHVLTKVFCSPPTPEDLADTSPRHAKTAKQDTSAPAADAWLQHPTATTPAEDALTRWLRAIGIEIPEDTSK